MGIKQASSIKSTSFHENICLCRHLFLKNLQLQTDCMAYALMPRNQNPNNLTPRIVPRLLPLMESRARTIGKPFPWLLSPSRLSKFPESGRMKEMTIWIILDCDKWAVLPCAHELSTRTRGTTRKPPVARKRDARVDPWHLRIACMIICTHGWMK